MNKASPAFALWVSLAVVILVLFLISPISPFIRQLYFVDVHTGRVRSTKYIGPLKVHDQIVETDTSRLWSRYFGKYGEANWQIAGRFLGFSRRSNPETAWNVTGWELELFSAFETGQFDEATKREILQTYIGFLERRDTGGAAEYVTRLTHVASTRSGNVATDVTPR